MKIGRRLTLAFSILLVLLLTVSVRAVQHFDAFTAKTNELIQRQTRHVSLTEQASQNAQAAAIHLLRLLHTDARESRVPLYAAMDTELAATDRAVEALGKELLSNELKNDVDRVVTLRKRYGDLFQETVELIEISGVPAARRHFEDNTDVALGALLRQTTLLADGQRETMEREIEQLRRDAGRAKTIVIVLALISLVAGGLLSWIIGRGIAKPLEEAVTVAQAVASGDYSRAVPVGANDEVGALLGALDTMRESIAVREERISRLAYVDTLTGLPNRTRFLEVLNEQVGKCSGAVLIVNIHRFAPINNALGYAVGDQLLCDIAARLGAISGEHNLLARLGGDEFALVLDQVDVATASLRAHELLSSLRAPIDVAGQRLDIDISIGVAVFPDDSTDVTTLLRRADLALKLAKRRHDGVAFGSEVKDAPAHEQLSLIGDMRDALVRNEFVVFYQPKLALAQNRITGAEALLRWRHPEKGLIPPMRFIPFAEQTGFIREITPWLLHRVIQDAAAWREAGIDIVVSANLSTLDLLDPQLVGRIISLLEAADLPAARLCLEITESALMDEPEVALKHLDDLAAHGLKLSIDDYGSGQASLGYVKNLPVHELKIDRVFVTDVDSTPKNAAIVRSTTLLCRELGLSVVAEGAETETEIAWLARNGCDMVQGYGVAKPMPNEDFVPWVTRFNQQTVHE